MNDPIPNDNKNSIKATKLLVSQTTEENFVNAFVQDWRAGLHPQLENHLRHVDDSERIQLFERLLAVEIYERRAIGDTVTSAEYLTRFPDLTEIVTRVVGQTDASDVSTVSLFCSDHGTDRIVPQSEGSDQSLPSVAPTMALPRSDSASGTSRSRSTITIVIPGYEIVRELGRGGMGVVYLAQHTRLKRLVALKVIRGADGAAEEDFERFRTEAEAVAALQHPNIVQIFEVGELENGPFCTLEYVDGGTLAARLKQSLLPTAEAAMSLETLARAVNYAHQKGIVHRDLKPANVLMASDGTLKITDFGLAKRIDIEDSGLTRTGAVMGTPAYMAPEQARGATKEVGPAADIYALGAILYELLTGRHPFSGATLMETLQQVLTADPIPPSIISPAIPRDLETICLKCLMKQPEGRYASALLLAQDIERFRTGEPILARREGIASKIWRKARKRVTILSAIAVSALALTAAVFAVRETILSRRVAAIANEFQEGLDSVNWSEDRANELERMAKTLGEFEISRGEAARQKLLDHVAVRVSGVLRRARVTSDDVPGLQHELAWITKRDETLAERLRSDLSRRLRDWQPIIEVAKPFTTLDGIFSSNLVQSDTQKMLRIESSAAVIPTVISSRGRVRATVEFGGDWESSSNVGLVIHYNPTSLDSSSNRLAASGYEFLFVATAAVADKDATARADSSKSANVTFRDSERRGELRMMRNGILLQRRSVAVEQGALRLLAERDGELLRVQINNLPALSFADIMPLVGNADSVFGLNWPLEASVTRLQVDSSLIPPAASPLERADDLFDRGYFADALAQYEEQIRIGDDVALEARCKAGMCLNVLNRQSEAATAFEDVVNSSAERWPIVAATQLWLMRLREKRYSDAEALFAAVNVRFTSDQLAQYVPLVVREELVRGDRIPSMNLLHRDPEIIPRIEAMYSLSKLLGLDDAASDARSNLMVAQAVNGNYAQAIKIAEEESQRIIARLDPQTDANEALFWSARWLCWSQRVLGEADLSKDSVKRLIASKQILSNADENYLKNYRVTFLPLQLELARNFAAVDDWQAAEDAVDKFINEMPRPILNYSFFSQPYLLKGFFLARNGDQEGAVAFWKLGIWQAYVNQFNVERRPKLSSPPGMWGLIDYWILAALSDSLSDDDTNLIWRGLLARASSDPLMAQVSNTIQVAPDVIRGTWLSPRGRALAQRLAFFDVEPIEYMRIPPKLVIYEKFRQELFAGQLTSEQDDATWSIVNQVVEMHFAGRLSKQQILQLALTWKGSSGFLGWATVAPTLQPEVRGGIAYLMGLRYLKLNKPEVASGMFRTASESDDAAVKPLALQALEQLGT